jgi:GNAT superfamily N-acetyltransferase
VAAGDPAEDNLVAHMTWVQSRLAGGRVECAGDLVLSDSGIPCDTFNFVCRARLGEDPRPAIARVVSYFGSVRRPFSWWVGPRDRPHGLRQALLDAGFAAAESEVAMEADLAALAPAEPSPDGLRIERATTAGGIRDYALVVAANWSPPDAHVIGFYDLASPILRRPDAPIRLYVGYLGETPVATAEMTVSVGAVGLYGIATLAACRRRGFGTALTLRPLLDARREGHTRAVLQASTAGRPVYARLGFRETGAYTEYQLPG